MNTGTQTLEGSTRPYEDQITKHGKAAHCRSDDPFLLKSHVIQSQSWHSHCDPNDALEKRARRRRGALGCENKF